MICAVAFAATNLDDLFLNAMFFAEARNASDTGKVVLGKYLGLGILVGLSLLGACGVKVLAGEWHRWLGLIPLGMGLFDWIKGKKEETSHVPKSLEVMKITAITLAGGGDNIGVYIPLLAGFSRAETGVCILTFVLLAALWCILGRKLGSFETVRRVFDRYRRWLVPLVYGLLGMGILLG